MRKHTGPAFGNRKMDVITKADVSRLHTNMTAIITSGGFRRSNSKAAAEARFIKVATEAGIANAADIAHGPFDMAEHVIREKLAGKALTIAEVKAMGGHAAGEPSQVLRQRNRKAGDGGEVKMIKPRSMGKTDSLIATVEKAAKPASGKRAAILEAAQRGEIPDAPDFSAPSHARFRKKLAEIVAMVEAGDVAGLKVTVITRYRAARRPWRSIATSP